MSCDKKRTLIDHIFKVSFSDAVHICLQFFRSEISPPTVEVLLMRFISPIRSGRTDSRKLAQKPAVSFAYRVAQTFSFE